MSSDTEKHRDLLPALRDAQYNGDGSLERAVKFTFVHVFSHLRRLNSHVPLGDPEEEDRHLRPSKIVMLR
ncbi:hypothetical protein [Methylobacterium sp. J-077]|uniref:hypothetical protein n=1 Tax=Methylobacterium sp. J-077 TaxID=2836656 RepID=UPI001FBA3BA8|nr:hypothetical protein [Methylobacterium sp. J-077]MCJ2125752.1 hypothetical protein [Methylobacterium sp. J-077]